MSKKSFFYFIFLHLHLEHRKREKKLTHLAQFSFWKSVIKFQLVVNHVSVFCSVDNVTNRRKECNFILFFHSSLPSSTFTLGNIFSSVEMKGNLCVYMHASTLCCVCIRIYLAHSIQSASHFLWNEREDLLAYLLHADDNNDVCTYNTYTQDFFVDNDFQDILVIYYQIFVFDRLMAKGKMVFISLFLSFRIFSSHFSSYFEFMLFSL